MAKTSMATQTAKFCASQTHATLDYPFGEQTSVYKVGGKMFALLSPGEPPGQVTLKVDPDDGIALREQYACIREGYYMNKAHWITVTLSDEIGAEIVKELVAESYQIVCKSLPKKVRLQMEPGG